MPKLPRIKASEVIRVLEHLGFVQVRQRGSHVILKKQLVDEGEEQKVIEIGCVVPLHRKTLAVGTLKSILNQAGVSVEQFIENL
ncbi:type II toxin-antitoxin system HicA family toxin [Plectonema radiosum NIES-515]|uniref:Type II toxin-antitoxin system HicA family toxin n=1 Tax=Plectonema radiosum NIES-515 TaxID=2986073 RepID=A0ABT3B5H0_9CYAN|nr:type II toxin-antitoxin system HicA family toxin [Plectonema radiosum]MCV3216614.1 type II toxin-antitoxin system HicA family toxin [Plectonema radiosum NIES-515]